MSSDLTALQKSMTEADNLKPFTEKQVLFINDTNGNSYNGSITFDTTVLSNSGRYLDYSDASIQIPIVLSALSSVDISALANSYMLGLKSGFHQVIDSIQVDYQNKNVVQQQSFTNFYVSYKLMSEFSQDDLEKFGSAIGFIPDDPMSFTRQAAANVRGDGITNNVPFIPVTTARLFTAAVPIQNFNAGLGQRIVSNANVVGGNGGLITTGVTAQQFNTVGKSYFTTNLNGANRIYTYYIIATIRLKDICDFFDKIPLLKGAQIRISINYNANRCRVTGAAGAGAPGVMSLTSTTQIAGRTCPFIVTPALEDQPFATPGAAINAGAGTFDVEYNIATTTNPAAASNPLLTSCRLVVPAYTMSADIEAKYLTSSPIKTIVYDDLYQYTVPTVLTGASFNAILTNGILNPQKLIIIPFVNGASNGATAFDEFRSPFDTAPATTGPLVSISSFQVQVSGKSMFDHPVNYDFEEFLQEVSKSGINGGMTTGLAAGLISRKAFQNGYRYYVCDLARRLQSADSIPLSVQISGINNTSVTVDYYCFITYQRTISLETSSGVVVQG